MSEMIERVADVIYDAANKAALSSEEYCSTKMAAAAARAAIEAMRKPTLGMVGACDIHETAERFLNTDLAVSTVWETMIDAALRENVDA